MATCRRGAGRNGELISSGRVSVARELTGMVWPTVYGRAVRRVTLWHGRIIRGRATLPKRVPLPPPSPSGHPQARNASSTISRSITATAVGSTSM